MQKSRDETHIISCCKDKLNLQRALRCRMSIKPIQALHSGCMSFRKKYVGETSTIISTSPKQTGRWSCWEHCYTVSYLDGAWPECWESFLALHTSSLGMKYPSKPAVFVSSKVAVLMVKGKPQGTRQVILQITSFVILLSFGQWAWWDWSWCNEPITSYLCVWEGENISSPERRQIKATAWCQCGFKRMRQDAWYSPVEARRHFHFLVVFVGHCALNAESF